MIKVRLSKATDPDKPKGLQSLTDRRLEVRYEHCRRVDVRSDG